MLINAGASDADCVIIHELNHAFEFHTIDINRHGCTNICGWDFDSIEFKQRQEHSQMLYAGITRKYELLNEYVNDRIAQEITDIMHNQGNFILNRTRGNNTSSYMAVAPLLEDFYQKFKDIIIKSRSNGNIYYLFDAVGKENFEALNDLVNDYYGQFGFGISGQLAFADYYHDRPNEHS